jgi:hypothetical protein
LIKCFPVVVRDAKIAKFPFLATTIFASRGQYFVFQQRDGAFFLALHPRGQKKRGFPDREIRFFDA